jgi:hypothetical protein
LNLQPRGVGMREEGIEENEREEIGGIGSN